MGIGDALDIHAEKAGDECDRQKNKRDNGYKQRTAIELFGAKVRQFFMRQCRAFTDSLQFFGHAGASIGGFAQVDMVDIVKPGQIRLGNAVECLTLGRDETAVTDGLRSDFRDLTP